ncbi:hypothetical protein LCGC14_0719820 [marine sediment metagenome]|uniref:Uncharacterized protein n=1 Tax=marine sediment metagenome TaxID=412755 RepID=A0A0F9QGZ1_9ZZZZ
MDEEKLIGKKKPEELIRVEKLIDDGKFDEAIQFMNSFEEIGGQF